MSSLPISAESLSVEPLPAESPPIESPSADPAAKVLQIQAGLCAVYGCPIPYFHDLDPLSELVSALLSHRTKNADSHRAFQQLTRRFPTWQAVCDAPTAEVEQAIAPCTWPEQKAPRIQQVLRRVLEHCAPQAASLDFLVDLPVPQARAWLEQLPGVGPKTSAAVLSFSRLRLRALPVDSHHHRVAVRLGLIGAKVDVGPAHALLEAQLPPDWTAQQVYDHHEVMMLHGQKCCFYRQPNCRGCAVLDLCPFGQVRLGRPAT
jgi:endonuclease-3